MQHRRHRLRRAPLVLLLLALVLVLALRCEKNWVSSQQDNLHGILVQR
jgi:uncharacterized membrane protein YoaK (UPF0700 family)